MYTVPSQTRGKERLRGVGGRQVERNRERVLWAERLRFVFHPTPNPPHPLVRVVCWRFLFWEDLSFFAFSNRVYRNAHFQGSSLYLHTYIRTRCCTSNLCAGNKVVLKQTASHMRAISLSYALSVFTLSARWGSESKKLRGSVGGFLKKKKRGGGGMTAATGCSWKNNMYGFDDFRRGKEEEEEKVKVSNVL